MQPLPIIPFPGEKFCPVPSKNGNTCSRPTVDVKDGIRVCRWHMSGRSEFKSGSYWQERQLAGAVARP